MEPRKQNIIFQFNFKHSNREKGRSRKDKRTRIQHERCKFTHAYSLANMLMLNCCVKICGTLLFNLRGKPLLLLSDAGFAAKCWKVLIRS